MILRAAESRLMAFMGGRPQVAAPPQPVASGLGQDAFVRAAEPVGGGAPVLRMGSRGDAVKFLQAALKNKGFDPGPLDGIFGMRTTAAVRAFQASAGIAVDGIAGPQTWGALSGPAAAPAPSGAPRAADAGHRIGLDNARGQYIKDPSFANNGAPIGNQRYIAFGDLRTFYLKGFSAQNGELKFAKGEIPIRIDGIPGNLDGRWAPEVKVVGDRVHLLYCAGEMHPGQGINWPSFRLRSASMPLDQFVRQAESGQPVTFKDHGPMFQDQHTFGGDPNFAMIDPQFWVNPQGKAFMSYTVVKHGIPGVRPHESFVRYREVDPNNPARAVGPDMPLLDGWSRGPHAGVAEAQDIVTMNGQPYVFISSKAGDIDQRVLAAPIGADLGRISDGDLKPVMGPGGAPWKSNAVGSTSAVTIDGQAYLLHQGMGADKHFNLGWSKLAL